MTPSRIVLGGLLLLVFVVFFHIFNRDADDVLAPSFPELMTKIEEKKVPQVTIRGHTYSGTYEDTRERFRTVGPPADLAMLQKLRASGVNVKYGWEQPTNLWLTILLQWMPVVVLFVLLVIFWDRLPKVTVALAGVLVVLFVVFFHIFSRSTDEIDEPSFTEFLTKVEQKRIRAVKIERNAYSGVYEANKAPFRTYGPTPDPAMVQKLRDLGAEVKLQPDGR